MCIQIQHYNMVIPEFYINILFDLQLYTFHITVNRFKTIDVVSSLSNNYYIDIHVNKCFKKGC